MQLLFQKILQNRTLDFRPRSIAVASGAIFVRLGNFFNSEIIGKETNSTFGIKFIRDQFSPRDAVNATQISNPNEAYQAIAIHNLSIYWNKFRPDILLSCMRHFAMFFVLRSCFSYTGKQARQNLDFIRTFLVLLFSVRIVVEYVKESQGGFESTLGLLSTGQWLSIPFIIIGLLFYHTAEKTSKNLDFIIYLI
jgi:prolipoprotein diacylglyceryltransferase